MSTTTPSAKLRRRERRREDHGGGYQVTIALLNMLLVGKPTTVHTPHYHNYAHSHVSRDPLNDQITLATLTVTLVLPKQNGKKEI